MRKIRFPKVRVTDHRPPPGAGEQSPLERTARLGAAAWPDSEHDKWVSLFEAPQLRQMLAELEERQTRGADWATNQWVKHRISALKRRLKALA